MLVTLAAGWTPIQTRRIEIYSTGGVVARPRKGLCCLEGVTMRHETSPRIVRLEDLQPIRAPETFEPDELVIVVAEVPIIAELRELLAA